MRTKRGVGDSQSAQPHRGEALLAHTSCRCTPGGLERHPIPQDPSLQVGRCDLNPKQLLCPSAVSPCHGRGHLPYLKSLYQALQGTFTPLTSPWARAGGGGHQTITSAALGVPDTSKDSESLFPGLLPLSVAAVLQGQAPFLNPQHPLSLEAATQLEYSCTPSTPIPWRKTPGCHLPAPPASQSLGDRTQVLCSFSFNRHHPSG